MNVGGGSITNGSRVLADDQVYDGASSPPNYANGWLIWDIPVRYNVGGGGWTVIDTATHRGDVDGAGKKTIQKDGVGPFSKNLADVNSNW